MQLTPVVSINAIFSPAIPLSKEADGYHRGKTYWRARQPNSHSRLVVWKIVRRRGEISDELGQVDYLKEKYKFTTDMVPSIPWFRKITVKNTGTQSQEYFLLGEQQHQTHNFNADLFFLNSTDLKKRFEFKKSWWYWPEHSNLQSRQIWGIHWVKY